MHNAAWPKLFWQFYDYYLMPTGAFYGARQACQPQTLIYHYGDNGIYLVNQSLADMPGLKAVISAYDLRRRQLFKQDDRPGRRGQRLAQGLRPAENQEADARPGSSTCGCRTPTASLLAGNFYWLSTKPDVLDYGKSEWFFTPCKEWADLTALNELPPAAVQSEYSVRRPRRGTGDHGHAAQPGQEHRLLHRAGRARRNVGPDHRPGLLGRQLRLAAAGREPDPPRHLRRRRPGRRKAGFQLHGWNVKGE